MTQLLIISLEYLNGYLHLILECDPLLEREKDRGYVLSIYFSPYSAFDYDLSTYLGYEIFPNASWYQFDPEIIIKACKEQYTSPSQLTFDLRPAIVESIPYISGNETIVINTIKYLGVDTILTHLVALSKRLDHRDSFGISMHTLGSEAYEMVYFSLIERLISVELKTLDIFCTEINQYITTVKNFWHGYLSYLNWSCRYTENGLVYVSLTDAAIDTKIRGTMTSIYYNVIKGQNLFTSAQITQQSIAHMFNI